MRSSQLELYYVVLSCIDHLSCLQSCKGSGFEGKTRPSDSLCVQMFVFPTLPSLWLAARCEMLGYHGQPHTQMSQAGPKVTSCYFILSFRFISHFISILSALPRRDAKTKLNVSGRMGTATTTGHRPHQS